MRVFIACVFFLLPFVSYGQPDCAWEKTVTLPAKSTKKVLRYDDSLFTAWIDATAMDRWLRARDTAKSYGDFGLACRSWRAQAKKKFQSADTLFPGSFAPFITAAGDTVEFPAFQLVCDALDSAHARVYSKQGMRFNRTLHIANVVDDSTCTSGKTHYSFAGEPPFFTSYWARVEFHDEVGLLPGSSCKHYREQAVRDVANGKLAIQSYGLRIRRHYADPYPRYTMWDFLTQDYGIIDDDQGCVVDGDYECYNTYMDSVIRARFGNDVYKRCAAKADSMTKKGMPAQFEKFPGGDSALTAFFKAHFPANATFCDTTNGVISISFFVDQQGKMDHTRIDRGLCYKLDSTLVDIATQLPRWEPAVNRLKQKMYIDSAIGVKVVNGEIEKVWVYWHLPVASE